MVKGAIRIETRVTKSYESGVYRITEEKQRFLLFAFEDADEARAAGKAIAKLLDIEYKDHIYSEPKLEGAITGRMSATKSNLSNEPKVLLFTRPKKVMGAPKLCLEMLTEGIKTETEIRNIFIDKYIKAGHKSIKAGQLADWLLKAAKKKI